MKILVTGANGFIAKNFIKFALSKKIKIIALSRKKNCLPNKNLIWIKGKFNKINFPIQKVSKHLRNRFRYLIFIFILLYLQI